MISFIMLKVIKTLKQKNIESNNKKHHYLKHFYNLKQLNKHEFIILVKNLFYQQFFMLSYS